MRRRITLAAAVFLLALSAPALAETPPLGEDPKALETAKALTRQAEIDYKLGRFEISLAEYTSAYQSYPAPALLLDIGQCHRMLKEYERALFSYKGYLRDAPDAKNRPVVEGLIAEMEQSLAAEAAAAKPQADPRDHAVDSVSPAPAAPAEPSTAPVVPAGDGRRLGKQQILAIASAGVGVVGLGVGVALGAVALSQKGAAETACPASACPTQDGVAKWSTAAATGNASTVALVIGGVGIAGAAVLWFTAPRVTTGPNAQVGLGPGTLQLRGTW
jgi:tetratricopeptide (TPR) repeat protein